MTRDEAIRRVMKLRALAERPGTAHEGDTAAKMSAELVKQFAIEPHELKTREELDEFFSQPDRAPDRDERGRFRRRAGPRAAPDWVDMFSFFARAASTAGIGDQIRDTIRRGRAAATAMSDHFKFPNRVHLAASDMGSVCGIGPSFVWVKLREELERQPDACPHCLGTGIIDAREPRRRLPGYPAAV
jgi:hypothetical protein